MMPRHVLLIAFLLSASYSSKLIAQDFRVQVGAYADSIPRSYFQSRGLEKVLVSVDRMGVYRYFIGTYNTREQAERKLIEVLEKGFAQATIIDLEEQRALGGATCPYNRPDRPVFIRESGQAENTHNLFFEVGSTDLAADARRTLDLVAQSLKENPRWSLKIIGQTDALGNATANVELATDRSRSARNYLLNKGIRADRMAIKVYGEAEAALPNQDEEGNDLPENRKWNRRVVLALIAP